MRILTLYLSILLVSISFTVFAEVTTVVVKNPDKTLTKIFYSEGKEVARQIQDKKGNVVKTTGKIPDGILKEYLENGQLKFEWNYKNGKLEGISKEYYLSGELLEDILYANNKREGISKKYYKSGKLLAERSYKNDKLGGMTRMYYKGGKVFAELDHKDGKLEGESKMYYEDGKARSIETYKNGEKIRLKSYDLQGKILVDHDYTSDKSITSTTTIQHHKDTKTGKVGKK